MISPSVPAYLRSINWGTDIWALALGKPLFNNMTWTQYFIGSFFVGPANAK